MGAKFKVQIKSVLGGRGPGEYLAGPGQYLAGFSMDPEFPLNGTGVRGGDSITPTKYSKFSGSNVAATPIAIITEPRDAKTYAILSNGKIVSYSSSLGSETLVGTVSGSQASGAAYYNNYIYIFGTGASADDVSRYGPLDGTPALTDGFWKTTCGLTGLGNPTYPAGGAVFYPNHWAHVHSDNKLYFCDYLNGNGMLHYIKTSKTTYEGDTNSGSTYNALTLPKDMHPSDIESYGINLAVTAFRTTDSLLNQGSSAMYLWDTTSANFQLEVPINSPICSALVNRNGELIVFSGELIRGYTVQRYLGGYSFEQLFRSNEGYAPHAGGVAVDENRVLWGTYHSDPALGCGVFALGYRDARLPQRAVNHVALSTAANGLTTAGTITAVKQVQQNSGLYPRVIMGWESGESSPTYGIDQWDSNSSVGGYFIGPMFVMGQRFSIDKVRIHLSKAVSSSTSIYTYFRTDAGTTTFYRRIYNTTDSGKQNIVLYPQIVGNHSFSPVFSLESSDLESILLPITIEGTLLDD